MMIVFYLYFLLTFGDSNEGIICGDLKLMGSVLAVMYLKIYEWHIFTYLAGRIKYWRAVSYSSEYFMETVSP